MPLRKAAALRYEFDKDPVPKLVAKGKGNLADKIVEIAQAHGIEVYEDPDLIELLCKLEVDQYVPQKLFVAVAEVMAYVYRVNQKVDEVVARRKEFQR